jgi:inner membrane protein
MLTTPVVRLALMGVLMMVLLVPLSMVGGLVKERATRRDEVRQQIGLEAGGSQVVVAGPVLVVPYGYSGDTGGGAPAASGRAYFLPENLEIQARMEPEVRQRSIFPVITYRAHLTLSGHFKPPVLPDGPRPGGQLLFAESSMHVGISDLRGISRQLEVTINGRRHPFVPGPSDVGMFATGVRAGVPLSGPMSVPLPFSLDLDLNGTGELRFIPAGDNTTVRLSSPWPHPAFSGAPLPEERRIERDGFSATWRVPHFARGFPSQWTSETNVRDALVKAQSGASAFGVALIQPVDIYQQTERAVKYAALFIVFTFVIAFLREASAGVMAHPVQYLFVGFALCLFYLLLLSLAEHVGFDVAYSLAAGATTVLLGWYWTWILRGVSDPWLMGAALGSLYGYLYLLLRLEDYALLGGSIGLFLMLALVMFLTRKVEWYRLRSQP